MPRISARVTEYSLKRLNKELDIWAERIPKLIDEQLWEIAQDAAVNAEEAFKEAEYDGYVDDIKVEPRRTQKGKISITASGEAVKFIEYGVTASDYIYFSGKGRNIHLGTDEGENALYKRLLREKDEDTGSIWFDYKGGKYLGEPIYERGNPLHEWVLKENSYRTMGNEPHNIMQECFRDIIENIEDWYGE